MKFILAILLIVFGNICIAQPTYVSKLPDSIVLKIINVKVINNVVNVWTQELSTKEKAIKVARYIYSGTLPTKGDTIILRKKKKK